MSSILRRSWPRMQAIQAASSHLAIIIGYPMTATALYQRLAATAAQSGPYAGAETALSFSGTTGELRTLYTGTGIFDLGWRGKITVTGQARGRWLNGMLTHNVRDLPV